MYMYYVLFRKTQDLLLIVIEIINQPPSQLSDPIKYKFKRICSNSLQTLWYRILWRSVRVTLVRWL